MPLYEYRCEDGHTFEVMQRMSDDPVQVCEVCGKPVQRVFHPVAVHFKGSGFYNTDYGKQRRGGAGASEDGGSSDCTSPWHSSTSATPPSGSDPSKKKAEPWPSSAPASSSD